MIRLSAALIFVFTVTIATFLSFYFGNAAAVSCLVGGSLMLVNLLGLSFVWGRVFSKKSVSLAALVMILKYIILGIILWMFSKSAWIHPLGFILGLSTLILAILSMTAYKSFVRKSA